MSEQSGRAFSVILPDWDELIFAYNGSHTVEVLYRADDRPLDAFTLYPEDGRRPTHAEILAAIIDRADEAAE